MCVHPIDGLGIGDGLYQAALGRSYHHRVGSEAQRQVSILEGFVEQQNQLHGQHLKGSQGGAWNEKKRKGERE
jgi:hypothetical protein